MAESVVAIANLALTELGQEFITGLNENNKRARTMNTNYTLVRDSVLRAFPWPCARARVSPGPDLGTPAWGWAYQFTLPEDCLRVYSLEDVDDEWVIEGRKLLSNSNVIKMLYIRKLTNVTEFDALLDMAIASRLAWTSCYSLTGSTSHRAALWESYKVVLNEARSIASQEQQYRVVIADDWLNTRIGPDGRSLRKPV